MTLLTRADQLAQTECKQTEQAAKQKNKAWSLAMKRLSLLKALQIFLNKVRDTLANKSHQREALKIMHTITM